MKPQDININEYDYELPDERIARFPLDTRDTSKLLLFKGGNISHATFRDIGQHLPGQSMLVFNDTKVIHARLYFTLPNGSRLEILCLEPLDPGEHQQSFSSTKAVRWKCLVGGNRKWKSGKIEKEITVAGKAISLSATRLQRLEDSFDIQLEWDDPSLAFGELLAAAGIIPLPPYLKREAVPSDEGRYQTVYAREEGSVAAPTAGLHFTPAVFDKLEKSNIKRLFITLHVGAGTFKPVKADRLEGHHMHEESVFISRKKLEVIQQTLSARRPVIPVGTTSMRLLESLYWHGLKISKGKPLSHLNVRQWEPYENEPTLSAADAIRHIVESMKKREQEVLQGHTQLIIAPGYSFKVAGGLITNFHQPRSTLLLLIAALIGEDWKKAYEYAMEHDFRFLSYGDSSLLLP